MLLLCYAIHTLLQVTHNYVTDTFNPDNTFTELFNVIIEQFGKKKSYSSLVTHLHKGMVELKEQDSWTYFKFPSFLKQARKIDKMAK